MIKKINFKKFIPSIKTQFKGEESLIEKGIPDKFETTVQQTMNAEMEKTKDFFSRVEYPELITSLIENRHWSDSVDFIGFNTKNDLIHSVNSGIFDAKLAEVKINTFSLEEFKELLLGITANNINKKPEKEVEYKRLYLDLLNYIKNNRFKN